jgi:hypothetical protein
MKRRQFIQTSIQASGTALLVNAIGPHPAPAAPPQSPRKLALLVGINDYSQGNTPGVDSLKGCINDVALLKNLLIYRYGFAPNDIITLTDAQATREAILANFNQHLLTANSQDQVVFAFSGHGSRVQISSNKTNQPKDLSTAILPYYHTIASDGQANYITGTTLFLLRSAFLTENVTVILDCCYAGGGTRGDAAVRSVQESLKPMRLRPSDVEQQYQADLMTKLKLSPAQLKQYRLTQQGTKGILLAAAAESQKALDATFSNNYHAGAFTKFLTETLWANPNLSLDAVAQSVTQALQQSAGDPSYAQTPVFTYSPQQASQRAKQLIFNGSTQSSSSPAQGTVLAIDRTNRQVQLWLGGIAASALSSPAGTEFRLLSQRDPMQSITTITQPIAPDFTAIATIPPNQPLPRPGTLLQQYYRPFARDFQLNLGLDPSIIANQVQFPGRSRIQTTTPQTDGRFNGVDRILSQFTPEYDKQLQQTGKRPEIGSYGLFSKQLAIIPNSFGKPGETQAAAIERLIPLLKVALVEKLFRSMSGTAQELTQYPDITAKVYLQDDPSTIVALPNQVKRLVKAGQTIAVEINNTTGQNLNLLLLGIAPSGTMFVRSSTEKKFTKPVALDPEDGTGLAGGFLVLVSAKPLNQIQSYLDELIEEVKLSPAKSPSQQTSRTVGRNQIEGIFSELSQTPRSSSNNAIDQLVISLPIYIAPT